MFPRVLDYNYVTVTTKQFDSIICTPVIHNEKFGNPFSSVVLQPFIHHMSLILTNCYHTQEGFEGSLRLHLLIKKKPLGQKTTERRIRHVKQLGHLGQRTGHT